MLLSCKRLPSFLDKSLNKFRSLIHMNLFKVKQYTFDHTTQIQKHKILTFNGNVNKTRKTVDKIALHIRVVLHWPENNLNLC